MKKKLAHLFLIMNGLNHEKIWNGYFRGHEDFYNIYVHAKFPENTSSDLLKKNIISHHCKTEYARFSLVRAELLLLNEAFSNPANQFFLLHSESCVPLFNFEYAYQRILATEKSWLLYHQGSMERLAGITRNAIPKHHFYKSSQFFCLTRSHADLVLAYTGTGNWESCLCPDEHYIPTVLSLAGKLEECSRANITYANWDKHWGFSPKTYDKVNLPDLEIFRASTALFARKFSQNSNIGMHLPFA